MVGKQNPTSMQTRVNVQYCWTYIVAVCYCRCFFVLFCLVFFFFNPVVC